MRRSLKTNTLVIVSKQFDKQYEDRWQGDILHYTGMGLQGPQDLNRSQNKTLNRHQELGVSVHLFEQFRVGEYHYQGEAYLSGSPYQETQPCPAPLSLSHVDIISLSRREEFHDTEAVY